MFGPSTHTGMGLPSMSSLVLSKEELCVKAFPQSLHSHMASLLCGPSGAGEVGALPKGLSTVLALIGLFPSVSSRAG